MADGSFRLEAWKDKDDMVDAPDIVAFQNQAMFLKARTIVMR